MQNPLISIVMPAYNHERFVGPAIEGVLNQSLDDFELVIVDDGSTDGTAAVIKSYTDSRIRYHHQQNQDAYNALNNSIALARGQYISILNSDDVYHPDRLSRCLATANAGAQAVFTGVVPVDEAGKLIPEGTHYWHIWHQRNVDHYKRTGDLYAGFLRGNMMVTTSNLFMTAQAARTVGAFAPLRYLHDYDYIFRLMLACPEQVTYLHDEALVYYRIHGANTLKQGAIKAREEDLQVIRQYLLAGLPETSRARAETGLDRIVELHHELLDVKRRLRWGRWLPLIETMIRWGHRIRS